MLRDKPSSWTCKQNHIKNRIESGMCVNGASRLALQLTWPDVGSEIDSLIINELRCASSDKRISKQKQSTTTTTTTTTMKDHKHDIGSWGFGTFWERRSPFISERILSVSFQRCELFSSVVNFVELCYFMCHFIYEVIHEIRWFPSLLQQDNKIEALNCRDLGELQELAVYSNNLSSVQGLEGCAELRSLDLQNNKITRIGEKWNESAICSLLNPWFKFNTIGWFTRTTQSQA